LGWRVLRKVENIVREEMDAIGAQEVHFPALLPREVYETTGRWTEYGDNLFRLKDRKGADFLLGPTHEEMFTLLVKDLYSSYKDLPVSLYQIQTKYRDEARPRAGLLRGREFLMKDSYSFDIDDEGLAKSYNDHRDAYERIFQRLGLPYAIVKAMSGAMGGSMSEEFLAPIEVGEDTFVRCTSCDYAANTEAVTTGVLAPDTAEHPDTSTLPTPNCPTIAALVEYLNTHSPRADRAWTAGDTLKNVVLTLRHPDGTTSALVVGVPGDRDVDIKRIEAQVSPAEVAPMDETEFAKHPGLIRGYIGPQVLGDESATGIRYLLDPSVVPGSAWVTGANAKDTHVLNLVNGRDFTANGSIEAVEVAGGDPCPNCGKALEIARGIEIGHVFQLGRKYAEKLELKVLDQNGKAQVVTMGSYGIGVSRAVASVAEVFHDEIGLKWPRAISPADVHVVVTGKNGDDITIAGEKLAAELEAQGLEVLLDDRNGVSPGVKFKDAELIGIPTIVVVGKSLSEGNVEIRDRHLGTNTPVVLGDAVAHVLNVVRGN
jgi:prolyl-tRNA synthetase